MNTERNQYIAKYFEFGNMGLGLIDEDTGLELFNGNEKKIYELIHHNLIGLLQTLEMINGKSYINWINIVPLNLSNYKNSSIYRATKDRIELYENNNLNNDILIKNKIDYAGLWFGDFYNVIRNRFYEQAKKIKWLLFPYEFNSTKIYLINGLNKMLDLDSILNNTIYDENKFKKLLEILVNRLKNNKSYYDMINIDFEICKYTLIYFLVIIIKYKLMIQF
jgi:hypothetical protein